MEFNSLSTDKADLHWEEDTELMVGYKVYVDGEPAPSGEYLSDENLIKVEDGVVVSIEEKEAQEPETPETPENTPVTEEILEEVSDPQEGGENATEETSAPKEDESENRLAELENRIADLEAKLEELTAKLAEIAQAPAAEPVIEEFEQATKVKSTGDRKLDKRIALAAAIRETK